MTDLQPAAEPTQAEPTAPAPSGDAKVAELSKESAAYRTQRNGALRRAHAFETMLSAHGIDTSGVTAERLDALPIASGMVDGQYDYSAPPIKAPAVEPRADEGAQSQGLSRETIEAMAPSEINGRWTEIKSWLAANQGKA